MNAHGRTASEVMYLMTVEEADQISGDISRSLTVSASNRAESLFWFAGPLYRVIGRLTDRTVRAGTVWENYADVKDPVELAPGESTGQRAGSVTVHVNDIDPFTVFCMGRLKAVIFARCRLVRTRETGPD